MTTHKTDVPPGDQKKGGTRHSEQQDEQRQPQPGTEGPEGHLDDQPQREDEYLSGVLKEFNPQRKDREKPVKNPDSGKVIQPDDTDGDAPAS